jgi:outer membrane receptor for ferrienterochelin and colicin
MIYFGYNGVFEKRKGGDIQVLRDRRDNFHQYFVSNQSSRHSVDGFWENKINAGDRFVLKGTGSWFDRNIETNVFGMKAKQLSWFTEASFLKKWKSNDLVAGFNLTGESFRRKQPDSSQLNNYDQTTVGAFIQNDWRITSRFIIQSGLRVDHHNQYGNFVLPRLSFLYRISQYFTSRLGGGLGYKIPTVFSSEIDERDYGHLLPITNVKAERSAGANWDINYHQKLNGWDLTANQTLFINRISHPLINEISVNNDIRFFNAEKPIVTKGFETYIQVLHDELEIYLGYIYTSARSLYSNKNLSLIAKNKFATVIGYEFAKNFRAGIEAAYTGNQFLDDGRHTPGYLFMAAMARFDVKRFAFVLNCENLLDYRQTKKETIIDPPITNPVFHQLWAPIDGRVVNFSIRITL